MIQSVACSQIGTVLIDSLLGGLASSIGFILILVSVQLFMRKREERRQKREHIQHYNEAYARELKRMGVKK